MTLITLVSGHFNVYYSRMSFERLGTKRPRCFVETLVMDSGLEQKGHRNFATSTRTRARLLSDLRHYDRGDFGAWIIDRCKTLALKALIDVVPEHTSPTDVPAFALRNEWVAIAWICRNRGRLLEAFQLRMNTPVS